MKKKKVENLKDIFEIAGSSTQLAATLHLHTQTVENWRRNGVPAKYWLPIMEVYGITAEQLHMVGVACRKHTYGDKEK